MNGGVDVLLDDSLGDEDRVLEVVTIPRHEGHKNVATECELAFFGVGTVGNDIAFLDGLTFFNDRLLVNTCARVGAHEFTKFVNKDAIFRVVLDLLFPFGERTIFRDDDLSCCNGGNFAIGFRANDGTRVAGDTGFKSGSHERRVGDKQRHTLALHVRTHERAVGVIVLKERNETGSHGNELFR